MRNPLRRRNEESGQAFVELGLVLPVLLLLLLGVIQFGNVFRDYIALTDATRVGARQAAVSRSIQPDANRIPLVIAKVQKAAVNLDQTQINITVEPVKIDGVTPGWEAERRRDRPLDLPVQDQPVRHGGVRRPAAEQDDRARRVAPRS